MRAKTRSREEGFQTKTKLPPFMLCDLRSNEVTSEGVRHVIPYRAQGMAHIREIQICILLASYYTVWTVPISLLGLGLILYYKI